MTIANILYHILTNPQQLKLVESVLHIYSNFNKGFSRKFNGILKTTSSKAPVNSWSLGSYTLWTYKVRVTLFPTNMQCYKSHVSILGYSIRNSKIFLKGTTFSKLNNNNGKDSNILTYIAIFGKYEEAYIGKIIQIKFIT